eukprot:359913-Chlamydomonas_euryale.AAC.15
MSWCTHIGAATQGALHEVYKTATVVSWLCDCAWQSAFPCEALSAQSTLPIPPPFAHPPSWFRRTLHNFCPPSTDRGLHDSAAGSEMIHAQTAMCLTILSKRTGA